MSRLRVLLCRALTWWRGLPTSTEVRATGFEGRKRVIDEITDEVEGDQ